VLDLVDRADPVDVRVAYAGVKSFPSLVKIREAELEEAIRINLLAPAALARTAVAGTLIPGYWR
jgi:short-subunit dehydrogenase